MAPVSTTLYWIEDDYIDLDYWKENLEDEELEREDPKVEDKLKTKFAAVEATDSGLGATILFQVPEEHSTFDGGEFIKEKKQARIRIGEMDGRFAVFIIAKSELQGEIASRMLDLLDLTPDEIEQIEITTENIKEILRDDGEIQSRATYKSVDENTSSASLAGRIGESSPAERMEKLGEKAWVIYESSSFESKIGLTRKSNAAVFYGDWTDDEMARYWRRIILPNL
jgi:hypothetical protein